MITLRLGERHAQEKYARELTEAILRNEKSCDIVWFSSLYGYPPVEVHKAHAQKMAKAADIFREAGIGISMQVANTLGHGEYMKSRDFSGLNFEGSPAEHIVGPDGTVAGWCYCWRGEYFTKYIEEGLRAYAELLKPDVVFFDDDLRTDNHAPVQYGCFCDNCMKAFNERYGCSFTREELAHEINYGDTAWRQKFIDFSVEGLYDFIVRITKAMYEVSPSTLFGIQQAHDHNCMGADLNFMYEALKDATGQIPQSRPGGGNYHDKAPINQFAKSLLLAYTNSLEPDYVKVHKAEVENLPDIIYGKSIVGTINESTLHLATGCTGLTYATLMRPHEPMEWHEKMLKAFSKIRPYWDRLGKISEDAVRSGITIFRGEAPYMREIGKDEEPWAWDKIVYELDPKLFIDGIPVVHDQRMPNSYLLPAEMVDYLTDNDIEYLLTKPVVTDAAAVKKLKDRGYGDRFRLELEPLIGGAREVFTSHPINADRAGRTFSESSFFRVPMDKYAIKPTTDETESLGELIQAITNKKLGEASVLTPIFDKDGNRKAQWAVFGYCLWNDMISSAKRNQILGAIDYLAPLPAKLISDEQAAVCASVDPMTGKTVAFTVASASQGGTEEIDIVIRNPESDNIEVMSTRNLDIKPLSVRKEGNELFVTLPELNPYEVVTIFC